MKAPRLSPPMEETPFSRECKAALERRRRATTPQGKREADRELEAVLRRYIPAERQREVCHVEHAVVEGKCAAAGRD